MGYRCDGLLNVKAYEFKKSFTSAAKQRAAQRVCERPFTPVHDTTLSVSCHHAVCYLSGGVSANEAFCIQPTNSSLGQFYSYVYFTPRTVRIRIAISVYVCLSVHSHRPKTTCSNFNAFLCMLIGNVSRNYIEV